MLNINTCLEDEEYQDFPEGGADPDSRWWDCDVSSFVGCYAVVHYVLRTDIMFIFMLYCNNNSSLDDLVILFVPCMAQDLSYV
jgi:hypothetical protein